MELHKILLGYLSWIQQVAADRELSEAGLRVAMVLPQWMPDIYASVATIAAAAGLGERGARGGIRALEVRGWILRQASRGRSTNSYTMAHPTRNNGAGLNDPNPAQPFRDPAPSCRVQPGTAVPGPGTGGLPTRHGGAPKLYELEIHAGASLQPSAFADETARDGTPLDLFADDLAQLPAPANPQARIPTDTPLPDLAPDAVDPVGPMFPVKGGAPWRMVRATRDTFARTFPGVDLDSEFQKAATWCASNPAKQKTARGMPRFLNSWLGRAQPQQPRADEDAYASPADDIRVLTAAEAAAMLGDEVADAS